MPWDNKERFYVGDYVELSENTENKWTPPSKTGKIVGVNLASGDPQQYTYIVEWTNNKRSELTFKDLQEVDTTEVETTIEGNIGIDDLVEEVKKDSSLGTGKVLGIGITHTTPYKEENRLYTVKWSDGSVSSRIFKDLKKVIKKDSEVEEKKTGPFIDGEIDEGAMYGDYGPHLYGLPLKKTTIWETTIDKVTECSKTPSEIEVFFSPLTLEKLRLLNEKYPNIEWLVYFLGNKEKREITDLIVPKQRISTASVDDVEADSKLQIIGVGHSHHGMNIGFSSKDWDNVNINHDISVLIHNTGIMEINVRVTTPCGCIKDVRGVKRTIVDDSFNKEFFLKTVEENVSEHYYVRSSHGNCGTKGISSVQTINQEDDKPMDKIDKRLRKFIRRGKIHTKTHP